MSRLDTSYAISWSDYVFTITYASTYSPVSFSSFDYVFDSYDPNNTFFRIGTAADGMTTLKWSKETALGASSLSDLATKVAALVVEPATSTDLNSYVTVSAATTMLTDYVDLASAQTITGAKTFSTGLTTFNPVDDTDVFRIVHTSGNKTTLAAEPSIEPNRFVYIPSGSIGVASNLVLHNIAQTITGLKTFSNGLTFGQTTFDHYQEGDVTFTWSCGTGGTTADIAAKVTRVGRVVTVFSAQITGVTSGSASTTSLNTTTGTALPTWARPATSQVSAGCFEINDGGTRELSNARVTSSGHIVINKVAAASFGTASALSTTLAFNLQWVYNL